MIILETVPKPKVGRLNIASQSIDVRISAEQAQEKVGEWLVDDVSTSLEADSPTFIIGERPMWRVPVTFYAIGHGRVGEVGTIDIDALSSEILADADEAIEQFAPIIQKIVGKLPPRKPRILDPLPDKYKSDMYVAKVVDWSEVW